MTRIFLTGSLLLVEVGAQCSQAPASLETGLSGTSWLLGALGLAIGARGFAADLFAGLTDHGERFDVAASSRPSRPGHPSQPQGAEA